MTGVEGAGFAEFAAREAHGASPAYERLSCAVAADAGLLTLLGALPPEKRQPNLLFAVVRSLGGPVGDPDAFRAWTREHWAAIELRLRTRATQTNEPGRCAVLLPVLAALPAPPDDALYNVLSLDGEPLAWTRSHGQALTWFG